MYDDMDFFDKAFTVIWGLLILSLFTVVPWFAYKNSVAWNKWMDSCYAANGYVIKEAYGGDILCESSDRKILGEW